MSGARSTANSNLLPDFQQQQAIEHIQGPVLVVAGAGTGKTTVLTRRVAKLIREGHARSNEIVALTYTDNAAKEMLLRVQREAGIAEAEGVQITTFHAYCNNLLHRTNRSFRVLDDKQLWIFLRKNLRQLRLNYYVRAAATTKFLDDLLDFIRRCHDELVGPEQYLGYVRRLENGELPLPRVSKSKDSETLSEEEALGRCREIAFVFEKAESMLRERGFGTFGHMILRANELLAEDPAVLEQQRRRAKFILVDEFQDANYAQIKVLEKLAGPERNIFAVGDPDQGIYRFRGASSAAFELFQRHFPGAKLIVLGKNRRSTTPILRCAFELISQNPEFALQAPDARYERAPLLSARDEEESRPGGREPVSAVLVTSAFMEAADLVTTLLEHKRRSRCEWKDIGILYRIHSHRDDVAAELARNGVPFTIEGLDVLDTPEARDLLACIGTAISDDSAALLRVAALRQFAVDPEELRNAMKGVPRDTQVSILSLLPKIQGGTELRSAVLSARGSITGHKIYAALLALSRQFQIPRTPATEALLRFATQWEESPITEIGSPAEFLEYLTYFREARGVIPLAFKEDENSVRLMTAHSAKGLEFDHVFILRAVKGSFPSYYRESLIEFPGELRNSGLAGDGEKQISDQEERRLFYVAITRARDTLTMYGQFGRGKTERTPPGYIRELLKSRNLKVFFRERKCREFQTDIFAGEEIKALSRIGEWIGMPPQSDLASTLSASAIQSYEMCPLRFKLEREWRIPSEASGALQYGAAMHRVLLTYYDSVRWQRTLSEAELLEQLRSDLAAAGFTDQYQRELYEKKGAAEIHEFLVSAERNQPEVLHTEEKFSFRVGETNVVGRIDRIDRSGDCVVVTDYKTGRARDQEDADESLQLSIYAMAAREKWGYRADRLILHNLDGNTQVVTRRSDADLNAAAMKVTAIACEIAAGKFDAKPGMHCGFCAYRVLCPRTEKRIPETLVPAAEPRH